MKQTGLLLLIVFLAGCAAGRISGPTMQIPEISFTRPTDSHYQQGWLELRQGRSREALNLFKLSSAPEDMLHTAFAYAFLLQEKFGLARQNLEKALALNPDNQEAALGWVMYFEARAEQAQAFRHAAALLDRRPDDHWLRVRYGKLKSSLTDHYLRQAQEARLEKKNSRYIEALEEAARYSPDLSGLRLQIAEFYQEQGAQAKALPHLEAAAGDQRLRESVLFKMAEAYEQLGNVDQALLAYHQLQELRPADPEILEKVEKLKESFRAIDLPQRFKNIYFKDMLNREDLAALISHYFADHLDLIGPPLIITDIGTSYAREDIVKIVSAGIMDMRPDHTFDRFGTPSRAGVAAILHTLYRFLARRELLKTELESIPELTAADVMPIHRDFEVITFSIRRGLLKLDEDGNFHPTRPVGPGELLLALNRMLSVTRPRIR